MGVEIETVKIMVDNQSTIMLSKTSAHHNRTKHIDTQYHFIRDCVEDGRVIIEHLKTKDQLANILTKALGRVKFGGLSVRIGVKKARDVKKIKENVGGDFPPCFMASACGTTLVCTAKHPSRTHGVQSVVTIAPSEVVPSGV